MPQWDEIQIYLRTMKPIICLFGQAFKIGSLDQLRDALQKRLDKLYPDKDIEIQVDDNDSELEAGDNILYTFSIGRGDNVPTYCYIRYEEEGCLGMSDAKMLTGGIDFPGKSFLLRDSGQECVDIEDFANEYRKQCMELGASIPTDLEILQTSRVLQLIVEYPETKQIKEGKL